MIIVSYFTPAYRAKAEVLRASCDRFNHEHRIIEFPEAKSWVDGIHKKCGVILNALMDARQTVIWIDADCELLKPIPDEMWKGLDWAAHDWRKEHHNVNGIPFDPHEVLHSGGVTVWGFTGPAFELLLRWHRALVANPEAVDDQVLDAVINQTRIPLKWRHLPKEMNHMTGLFGPPGPNVIVRHDYVCR